MNKPSWDGVYGVFSLHVVITNDSDGKEDGRVYIQNMINEGALSVSTDVTCKASELAQKLEKEWGEFVRSNQTKP